jgi:hypothetical protein
MFKSLTREIALAVQARSGASLGAVVWLAIAGVASLTALIFLCVSAYDWLALQYGSVAAGLTMAGIFVLIAILAAGIAALIRRRVRERAILARAAKAHAPSWLLDPRVLGAAVEAGRSLGWERIIPMALLGFLAAQWARERQRQGHDQS